MKILTFSLFNTEKSSAKSRGLCLQSEWEPYVSVPTFYCAGHTGTGTVLFKILLEEWGGIGYNKYYEVTGEKMDIMCEGGTL